MQEQVDLSELLDSKGVFATLVVSLSASQRLLMRVLLFQTSP